MLKDLGGEQKLPCMQPKLGKMSSHYAWRLYLFHLPPVSWTGFWLKTGSAFPKPAWDLFSHFSQSLQNKKTKLAEKPYRIQRNHHTRSLLLYFPRKLEKQQVMHTSNPHLQDAIIPVTCSKLFNCHQGEADQRQCLAKGLPFVLWNNLQLLPLTLSLWPPNNCIEKPHFPDA